MSLRKVNHSFTLSIWSYFLWNFSHPVIEIRCKLFSIFLSYGSIHFCSACHSVCLLLLNNYLLTSCFYHKWCTRSAARSSINLIYSRLMCFTLVKLVNSVLLHLASITYIEKVTLKRECPLGPSHIKNMWHMMKNQNFSYSSQR